MSALLQGGPGLQLTAVTRAGQTALHLAVCNGHLAVTALLLDRPDCAAALNVRDAQGKLPLDLAFATKNQTMIDYFDSTKRATHLKMQRLEEHVAELQQQLALALEEKQVAIVKHATLFKEHLALGEASRASAAEAEQRFRSQEQHARELAAQNHELKQQLDELTARNAELAQHASAPSDAMAVEPSNAEELRNVSGGLTRD